MTDHPPCKYCGRFLCTIEGFHDKAASVVPEYQRIHRIAQDYRNGSLVNKHEWMWAVSYLWNVINPGIKL